MNEKQQIEEMARVLCEDCGRDVAPCSLTKLGRMCDSVREQAEALYNAGYRKQSEGEWIDHSEIGTMNCSWECSCCHWTTVSFTEMKHSKYCPNCGAKMKGGAE